MHQGNPQRPYESADGSTAQAVAAEIHIPRKNALDTAATWKSILWLSKPHRGRWIIAESQVPLIPKTGVVRQDSSSGTFHLQGDQLRASSAVISDAIARFQYTRQDLMNYAFDVMGIRD
jgi:hypothetical protein